MQSCKVVPPPGQDINEYIVRLIDILNSLSRTSNKKSSIERLDLMISSIKEIIQKIPPVKGP